MNYKLGISVDGRASVLKFQLFTVVKKPFQPFLREVITQLMKIPLMRSLKHENPSRR
jgi:hypothetical protein